MGKFFKWTGIGCGGLLALLVLLVIIIAVASSGGSDEPEISVAGDASPQSPSSAQEVPNGKTRTSPSPRGYSITHDDFNVTILDVTYSREDEVFATLDENHVWAIVDLRLEATGNPDRSHSYNTINFRLVGDRGVIYDEWAFVPDEDIGSGEVFGGATVEGSVIRQVHQEDTNLVLIFSPPLIGSRYLALESEP